MYRLADIRFCAVLALVCAALSGPAKLPAAGHTGPVLGEGLHVIHAGTLLAVPGEEPLAETLVAVDPLGADVGEKVLVVFGRAARHAIGRGHDIGFQTAVAAIVDDLELPDFEQQEGSAS